MELTEQARRDMSLVAELRAVATVLNEYLLKAAQAGLIVAVEVNEHESWVGEPPIRFVTVEVERV